MSALEISLRELTLKGQLTVFLVMKAR